MSVSSITYRLDLWHRGSASATPEPKQEDPLFSSVASPRWNKWDNCGNSGLQENKNLAHRESEGGDRNPGKTKHRWAFKRAQVLCWKLFPVSVSTGSWYLSHSCCLLCLCDHHDSINTAQKHYRCEKPCEDLDSVNIWQVFLLQSFQKESIGWLILAAGLKYPVKPGYDWVLQLLCNTYFRTWATVFGPYHWPIGFPSPTPIWAAAFRNKKERKS